MEQSYVSAAFFRHLTKERLQRHQAEQLLAEGMAIQACQGLLLQSHVLSCILRGDLSRYTAMSNLLRMLLHMHHAE